MALKMLKPYSILLYFTTIIAFFFIGVTYAGIVEAGKGQMLAGGAIVLGYGLMGSGIGLIIALFLAYKFSRKIIIKTNMILAISIIGFWGYYYNKYTEKQKAKELEKQKFEQRKTTTPKINKETAMLFVSKKTTIDLKEQTSGLGMFSPKRNTEKPLYFYENPNFEKSLDEHFPNDSITFKKTEHGSYDIATAPPWLLPDYLKLDYDILYFNVQSITQEFIEVTVNKVTKQTAFVSRYAGHMQYWPDFLLNVHSIEFLNHENSAIYVKPLNHAGKVTSRYNFMKPLIIKHQWMYVELQNDSFKPVGNGWIKWIKNGKLQITYSLLS